MDHNNHYRPQDSNLSYYYEKIGAEDPKDKLSTVQKEEKSIWKDVGMFLFGCIFYLCIMILTFFLSLIIVSVSEEHKVFGSTRGIILVFLNSVAVIGYYVDTFNYFSARTTSRGWIAFAMGVIFSLGFGEVEAHSPWISFYHLVVLFWSVSLLSTVGSLGLSFFSSSFKEDYLRAKRSLFFFRLVCVVAALLLACSLYYMLNSQGEHWISLMKESKIEYTEEISTEEIEEVEKIEKRIRRHIPEEYFRNLTQRQKTEVQSNALFRDCVLSYPFTAILRTSQYVIDSVPFKRLMRIYQKCLEEVHKGDNLLVRNRTS